MASGTAEVYVYNTSAGLPNAQIIDLGSVTAAGSGNFSVNLTTYLSSPTALTAGDTYAIVMTPPGVGGGWNSTPNVNGANGYGDATLGGAYYNFGGSGWNNPVDGNPYLQMDLEVSAVPEISMTGAFMGFGALVIGLGRTLRRRVPSISTASL